MIHIHVRKPLHSAQGLIQGEWDIDLTSGEFVTLFGPSGAGKTTLLRMIAGLEEPTEGKIEVEGVVWFDSTRRVNLPPQKRSIGMVFQEYALFPTMSVRENLLFAATTPDERAYVDTLLEMTHLQTLADRSPMTLSGGQQQRVALARALVRHPKILLLDEPLSALDTTMRHTLQEELLTLQRALGITTVLVSHDIAESVRLSHRIARIDQGSIHDIGTPQEIFAPKTLEPKLNIVVEVIAIEVDFPLALISVCVGNTIVRSILTYEEAQTLRIGSKALLCAKAFGTYVRPLT